MIIENLFKPTVVEGSAANDYFTRRKSEEERIAGTRPPAKNKNNPADTDYSKRRAREKKVDQGVAGSRLNEFAPGGNSASSYYAVTENFVNEFAQQKQEEIQDLIDAGWTKKDLAQAGTQEVAAADIVHFEQVRDSFLKGLKPGFDAYLQGDTQLKDQLGAYWIENDLPLNQDWGKIYGEPWGDDGEFNEGVAEGKVINTYLWHGSRQKIPMLEPRQSVDTGGAAGSNQNAIYATSDPKVAIAMGLTTAGSDTGMFPNDPQMVLFSGKIRKGEYVYLHKLPFNGPDEKPQFVQGGNSREFHSIPGVEGIKPIEIKEIPVNKYLNLIRKATPSDLKLRKKYMKEQGVVEGSELRKKYMKKAIKEVVHPDIFDKHISNEPTEKVRMDDFEFKARPFRGRILGHGNLNDIGLSITAHDRQNVIGWAHFVVKSDEKGNQWLESEWTEVDDDYMSRGVAAMMYAFAKSLGNDVKPSPHQSTWGKRMWKKWGKDAKHLVGEQGVAEGAPIVVMPRADRLKKPEPTKVRYQGDIVPPTKPPSTEKRGVKGRAGQRPMPKYDVEEAKKKGISEGRVKELITDLRELTDAEFQAQYKMTKAEARAGLSGKNESVAEARMSAAQRLSMAWDKQRAKSDASLRRTPSSIPKSTPEPKKTDTGPKTVSESRVKRRALMAQMLNSR